MVRHAQSESYIEDLLTRNMLTILKSKRRTNLGLGKIQLRTWFLYFSRDQGWNMLAPSFDTRVTERMITRAQQSKIAIDLIKTDAANFCWFFITTIQSQTRRIWDQVKESTFFSKATISWNRKLKVSNTKVETKKESYQIWKSIYTLFGYYRHVSCPDAQNDSYSQSGIFPSDWSDKFSS